MRRSVSQLPTALVRDLADYLLRSAVDILRKADARWLSEWVITHVVNGALWREDWLSLILGISVGLQDQLFQRVCTENLHHGSNQRVIPVLRATASAAFARKVFVAVRDHRRELAADPQNQDKQAIDNQLRGLLHSISREILVEGLSDFLAQPAQDDEWRIIADLFGRIGEPAYETKASAPEASRQKVGAYLKSAIPIVLQQDDLSGEPKGHLSVALAEVGQVEDATDLVALIHSDIERVREGWAARGRGERSRKAQQSSMLWSPWHVHALDGGTLRNHSH